MRIRRGIAAIYLRLLPKVKLVSAPSNTPGPLQPFRGEADSSNNKISELANSAIASAITVAPLILMVKGEQSNVKYEIHHQRRVPCRPTRLINAGRDSPRAPRNRGTQAGA
jgi:hypothetical protein